MLVAIAASAAEVDSAIPPSRGDDARKFVSATSNELLAAVSRERDDIRRNPSRAYAIVNDILGRHVDAESISRLVLGKHWRTATPSQRERFKIAFLNKLIQTFVAGVSERVSVLDDQRAKITYLSSVVGNDGRNAVVRTHLGGTDGHALRIDFRLYRSRDTWQFNDIVIEGASLVLIYRNSYAAQIERTGIDDLIERIRSETPGAYRNFKAVGRTTAEGS